MIRLSACSDSIELFMWFSFSDPNACITRGEGPLVERNGSGRFGVEVIVSILRLLHPHSGSLRKATNGLGYCTSVCYRRGGGESEKEQQRTFFFWRSWFLGSFRASQKNLLISIFPGDVTDCDFILLPLSFHLRLDSNGFDCNFCF